MHVPTMATYGALRPNTSLTVDQKQQCEVNRRARQQACSDIYCGARTASACELRFSRGVLVIIRSSFGGERRQQ